MRYDSLHPLYTWLLRNAIPAPVPLSPQTLAAASPSIRHRRRPPPFSCPPRLTPRNMPSSISGEMLAERNTPVLCGSSELDLQAAAELLRTGRTLAFPTETVYGLGANAEDEQAVSRIFAAKNRPPDNPLIVHLSSPNDISNHNISSPPSPLARTLMRAFWPGPLTLILPLSPRARLARAVTAGLPGVGLRIPRHPVAAALLARAGVPVAAPSANLSGRPSPTTAAHVMADLAGRIDGVVDGASPDVGLESTVVDVCDPQKPEILRLGAVTRLQMEKVTGVRFSDGVVGDAPRAPGMKYRHYAPRAVVLVCEQNDVAAVVDRANLRGKVGVLCETGVWRKGALVAVGNGPDAYARAMYAGLRALDDQGVDVIVAVLPADRSGVGEAVAERLRKAAGSGNDNNT